MPTPEQQAEEERQNQALLDAYQPDAQPDQSPIAFVPGGQMDTYAKQGERDLAYDPPKPMSAPAPAPVTPQAPPPAPPEQTEPRYTEDSTGVRVLKALAAGVPGIIGSVGAVKAAKQLAHSGAGPQEFVTSMGNRSLAAASQAQGRLAKERDAEHARQRQDWQDKNTAAQSAYTNKRQAWSDTNTAQDRAAQATRQGIEDTFSAEARDSNSTKSLNLRAEIRTAFPDYATSMGDDFEKMSLADFAKSPHPGLDKAKFDAMTQRQKDMLGTRGTQATGLEMLKQTGRIELKTTPAAAKLRAPGAAGSGGGVDTSEYEKALAAEFGGADKVPPTLLAQLHAAARAKNPNAAIKSVMQNAHGQKTGGEKQANAETAAYEKAAGPAADLIASTRELRQVLTSAGINPDAYKGQDIPGVGRVKSMMGDSLMSAEGQRVRAAITKAVLGMQQSMSHIRTSDQEAVRVSKSLGAMHGGSAENIIWGLHQMEAFAKEKAARAESERAPGARGGSIRVKTKDGKTGTYAGTADEARADGFTVVQ